MRRSTIALGLAALFVASAAQAGARDELTAFTKGLSGLQGGFAQVVFDANGRKKESSSGRVAVSAPRLFRWEYIKPYPQLIVADGKTVWVYDPDLKQVTKRAQGASEQNSPLAVLVDPGRLDRDYVVKEEGSAMGMQWLSIAPRKNAGSAGFSNARLGFNATGLSRMEFTDSLGQRTEISFAKWQRNPRFARNVFRYVPPKGVDVVGG